MLRGEGSSSMELGTYFELEVSFGESELLAYILAVLYLALGLTALVSFSSSLSLSLFATPLLTRSPPFPTERRSS